jgi:CheY-like chemotaxis protein
MSRARILLAEDDQALREVLRSILESLDLEVHEASDGFELLDLLTRERGFDLVVSDVRMPSMSGLQVAVALRNAGCDTPFIVLSAFGNPELRRSVARLGNALFLDKPVEPAALAAAANAALGRAG